MTPEFWITTLVVVATPGTGALYTISAGISRGAKASIIAAIGCTLGILPHMIAAIIIDSQPIERTLEIRHFFVDIDHPGNRKRNAPVFRCIDDGLIKETIDESCDDAIEGAS